MVHFEAPITTKPLEFDISLQLRPQGRNVKIGMIILRCLGRSGVPPVVQLSHRARIEALAQLASRMTHARFFLAEGETRRIGWACNKYKPSYRMHPADTPRHREFDCDCQEIGGGSSLPRSWGTCRAIHSLRHPPPCIINPTSPGSFFTQLRSHFSNPRVASLRVLLILRKMKGSRLFLFLGFWHYIESRDERQALAGLNQGGTLIVNPSTL